MSLPNSDGIVTESEAVELLEDSLMVGYCDFEILVVIISVCFSPLLAVTLHSASSESRIASLWVPIQFFILHSAD